MKEHAVSGTELRLLDFLLDEPLKSRTIRDIALQSSVDYKNCHGCVSKLVEKGVLSQERIGNALVCRLSAAGGHLIAYAEQKRSVHRLARQPQNVQAFAVSAVKAAAGHTKFCTIMMAPLRLYVAVDAVGLRFPIQRALEDAKATAGMNADVRVMSGDEMRAALKDEALLRQRIVLYGAEAFVSLLF